LRKRQQVVRAVVSVVLAPVHPRVVLREVRQAVHQAVDARVVVGSAGRHCR
jgi:hypothetical protein